MTRTSYHWVELHFGKVTRPQHSIFPTIAHIDLPRNPGKMAVGKKIHEIRKDVY